jgi:general secretion pathway protein L
MNVINIKDLWQKWTNVGGYSWPWAYDSFAELSTRKHAELLITKDGVKLFRKSALNKSLENRKNIEFGGGFEIISDALKSKEAIVISICSDLCFVNNIEIPMKAMSKIQSIIELEILKSTPFKLDQVYLAWESQNVQVVSGQAIVTFYLIRRNLIELFNTQTVDQSPRVTAIVIRKQNGDAVRSTTTLEGSLYHQKIFGRWRKAMIASAAILVLSLFGFCFSIVNLHRNELEFVENSVSLNSKEAVVVRKTIDAINAKHFAIEALVAKNSQLNSRANTIEELSKNLPDNTYLEGINVSDNAVVIDGVSENPEILLSLLEASPTFQDVSFNTPSFRNPGDLKSRFSIKFNLNSRGQ